MTTHDLKALCRLHKDDGRSSRISVPISVFEKVLDKALAYERLPEAIKELGREVQK